MNLDKISNEMEDALERARLLTDERKQSPVTSYHVLCVLSDGESALAATRSVTAG